MSVEGKPRTGSFDLPLRVEKEKRRKEGKDRATDENSRRHSRSRRSGHRVLAHVRPHAVTLEHIWKLEHVYSHCRGITARVLIKA